MESCRYGRRCGGVTIDLSAFELGRDDTVVTSAIPTGYVPKVGDKVFYSDSALWLNGLSVHEGIDVTYGFSDIEASKFLVRLAKVGDDWFGTLSEI